MGVKATPDSAYHAGCLHRFRDEASVRFTPEHVALKALRPTIHNHGEGVRVVAHTQEGEVSDLALPERLISILRERHSEKRG